MSLIKDTGEFDVVPDYNVSCEQVYIDVARALYAQGTIVLYHAIIGSKQRSLPSFVPDWSCKLPKTSILGSNEQIFGGNFQLVDIQSPMSLLAQTARRCRLVALWLIQSHLSQMKNRSQMGWKTEFSK
jgi:hypothetical protein